MRYFEVCKTSKLHSTRSVPPRQGQASCLSGSSRKGSVFTFFLLLQKEPKSRRSALPGRGRRPRRPVFYPAFSKAGEMFPKRNGFILFASTKRTKSSPEGCDPLDSEGRFKTLQNNIFRELPALVPKPIYGAARFFGCFEPVRKGYCSADARPLFFENGKPHYKLTGASHIRKGWLFVIFVVVGICFCGMRIKSFELNKFLQFRICQKQWHVN